MRNKTCCFTGHRKLPAKKIESIIFRLNNEVERLIQEGVTTFISGGALGFDQIAASLIASKKEMEIDIQLVMALPCRGQEDFWPEKEKEIYRWLLSVADDVKYISETYSNDCMKKRNEYMVKQSDYCVCALINKRSGTGQTVRYAKQKQRQIINVAK